MQFNAQHGAVRIFHIFVVSSVLSILGFLIWDSDIGYMYRMHLKSKSHLVLNFKDLDANTIQSDMKRQYPINWYCKSSNELPNFGDLVCADELNTWNGIPALHIILWYKKGRLNVAKIEVPFWHHEKFIHHLMVTYGKPTNVSSSSNDLKFAKNIGLLLLTRGEYKADEDIAADKFAEWILPNRTKITATFESDSNPLSKSMVLWQTY